MATGWQSGKILFCTHTHTQDNLTQKFKKKTQTTLCCSPCTSVTVWPADVYGWDAGLLLQETGIQGQPVCDWYEWLHQAPQAKTNKKLYVRMGIYHFDQSDNKCVVNYPALHYLVTSYTLYQTTSRHLLCSKYIGSVKISSGRGSKSTTGSTISGGSGAFWFSFKLHIEK